MNTKTHYLLTAILLGCILLTSSCEDSTEDPNLSPVKLNITASLGENDSKTPLYIYGSRDIDYSVSTDKGNIDLVQFFYKGVEIKSFTSKSGKFYFTPDMSTNATTDLEMKVSMTVEQKKYNETITYKVQYVKISKEDFELKEETIDRFVFKMIGEKLENYKYILGGKVIEDMDNIILPRKFAQYSFPTESSIRISLVPKEHEYYSGYSYPYVDIDFKDKKLGDFHAGSTKFHYIDAAHKELYVWTYGEISVFDSNMNEIKNKSIENTAFLSITPKSGLAVTKSLYGNVLTYSDNNFSTLISTTDLNFNPVSLRVSEKDQLFNGHNFQIDVYDLYTGKSVYSLKFQENVSDYTILGDKLLVKLGNDGQGGNQVYQLNDNSATFLYSFEKTYRNCIAHPINHNHIILSNTYNGFEIFDLESRTSLASFKGQFQSIDPIKGTLLYYDENYGVSGNYNNHILDSKYNKISTFEDASQSTNGAFLQFNNYIIKSGRYTNLLPKEK